MEKLKWASGQVMPMEEGEQTRTTATHCPTHSRLVAHSEIGCVH